MSVGWASGALVITCSVAILAKGFGVLVAPGVRGTVGQKIVETVDALSATFGYTLAALLVALVCGASFELARARKIGVFARGFVVAISGLVVALASPAVVQRLHVLAALALAIVSTILALVAGVVVARSAHTRALGAVLGISAVCAGLRVIAWSVAAASAEHGSLSLLQTGRTLATIAVILQGVGVLAAAAWLGTRSKWRGRILANGAIVAAFAVTYIAGRVDDDPSVVETVLHASLAQVAGVPAPYGVGTIAAFLVPASILLACALLVLRGQPIHVTAPLVLALLSSAAFDVPLQALLITAAAQWAMLGARSDEGSSLLALQDAR